MSGYATMPLPGGMTRSRWQRDIVNRWPPGFVSKAGLMRRAGLSPRQLDYLVQTGKLPAPERVTPVKKGWRSEVIEAWLAARPA